MAQKIAVRVDFRYLHHDEWFQMMSEYRERVRNVGAETLKILDLWDPTFVNLWTRADKVMSKIIGSDKTPIIDELDKERDRLYSGLRDSVKALVKSYEVTKSEAAQRVMYVFKTYGNVPEKGKKAETGAIYNVVQDLRTTYQADMTLLGLSQWVTELDKANKEYENKYVERAEADADKNIDDNMEIIRPLANRSYLDMIERMEVLSQMEGISTWEAFFKVWNELAEKYRIIAERRKNEAKKDNENNEKL